ncbi:MAG: 4-hydroxy-tetrahydrodipicolinate reductase, partial [Proteobacteria bacterium]|nr:4-hydroxy-tetrahydrodipicolinate reductase [Pseudomonadota bacterium]
MAIKIGVCGAAGRMGKTILEVCNEIDNVKVAAAIEYKGSSMIGIDAGEQAGIGKIGVAITDDIAKVADQF